MQKIFTRKFPLKLGIQFWQLGDFFCGNWSKNRCVQKWKKREKNCSLLKCYSGHVKCSSNIPVEKLDKKPKSSCSMSKIDENFHLFSKKMFFLQNDFIDTKNAVLTGRQKFFLLNYWKWSEKKSTKNAKMFQNYFPQNVPLER